MKILLTAIVTLLLTNSALAHKTKGHPNHKHPNSINERTLFHIGGLLNETSGAVYDYNQKVFWAVGDSGPMVLARVNEETKDVQIIPIEGVVGGDREELVMDNNGFLWILCVGDNHDRHKNVHINQVDPRSYVKGQPLKIIKSIEFTYPGGPNDVEGAWVYNDELFLIQKSFLHKSWIYTLDISPKSPTVQVAKYFKQIVDLPKMITGACMNKNENVFFVTYWGVYKLRGWKTENKLKDRMVEFNPTQWTSETLVCKANRLIVARETGRFFYSLHKD
jgi:hypothetical protein